MESINPVISEVSWCVASSWYFCSRKFLRHLILQKSWFGTADVDSKIVDLSSPMLLCSGSSLNSFLIPDKFEPVPLLMSTEAKLGTSLTSKLWLVLTLS